MHFFFLSAHIYALPPIFKNNFDIFCNLSSNVENSIGSVIIVLGDGDFLMIQTSEFLSFNLEIICSLVFTGLNFQSQIFRYLGMLFGIKVWASRGTLFLAYYYYFFQTHEMATDDKTSPTPDFANDLPRSPTSPSHLTHFKPLTPDQDEPPFKSAYSSFVNLFRFNKGKTYS